MYLGSEGAAVTEPLVNHGSEEFSLLTPEDAILLKF